MTTIAPSPAFNTDAGATPVVLWDVPAAHSVFAASVVRGAELKSAITGVVERACEAFPPFAGWAMSSRVEFTEPGAGASVRVSRAYGTRMVSAAALRRAGWQAGAKVRVQSGIAHIVLPAVDDDRRVPRAVALDWCAYAAHEALHVLLTFHHALSEEPLVQEMSARHGVSPRELRHMCNSLEDPRIEMHGIRHGLVRGFPNLAINLVAQHMRGIVQLRPRCAVDMCSLLAYYGRAWLPQGMRDAARAAIPPMYRTLCDDTVAELRALALDTPTAEAHTWEGGLAHVWALLDKFLRGFQAAGAGTPGAGTPGAGTPGDGTPGDGTPGDGTPGDGTPGAGTPGAGTPGDGTPGDGTPGDGTPGKGDGTPGDDQPGKGGPTAHGCGREGADMPDGPLPLGTRALGGAAPYSSDLRPGAALDPSGRDATSPLAGHGADRSPVKTAQQPASAVEHVLQTARHAPGAPRVGVILRTLLAKTDRTELARGKRSGRVNPAALARVACGADNVFQRRSRYGADAASVAVAIDASGSMSHTLNLGNTSRMQAAHEAALLIADAMRGAQGSECLLYAFGASPAIHVIDSRRNTMRMLKEWREPMALGMRRTLSLQPAGGTPIVDAVAFGVRELSKRRAGRRVLLVITDGDCLPTHTLAKVDAEARARRIVVIGVGLGCSLKGAFRHHLSVHNAGDLASAAMRAIVATVQREYPAESADL